MHNAIENNTKKAIGLLFQFIGLDLVNEDIHSLSGQSVSERMSMYATKSDENHTAVCSKCQHAIAAILHDRNVHMTDSEQFSLKTIMQQGITTENFNTSCSVIVEIFKRMMSCAVQIHHHDTPRTLFELKQFQLFKGMTATNENTAKLLVYEHFESCKKFSRSRVITNATSNPYQNRGTSFCFCCQDITCAFRCVWKKDTGSGTWRCIDVEKHSETCSGSNGARANLRTNYPMEFIAKIFLKKLLIDFDYSSKLIYDELKLYIQNPGSEYKSTMISAN